MPGLLQKYYGTLIAIAGTMVGQKAKIVSSNGDFSTFQLIDSNLESVEIGTNDLVMCICPYCKIDILSDITKDNVICPICNNICDIWADGDIDFNFYYLTKLKK